MRREKGDQREGKGGRDLDVNRVAGQFSAKSQQIRRSSCCGCSCRLGGSTRVHTRSVFRCRLMRVAAAAAAAEGVGLKRETRRRQDASQAALCPVASIHGASGATAASATGCSLMDKRMQSCRHSDSTTDTHSRVSADTHIKYNSQSFSSSVQALRIRSPAAVLSLSPSLSLSHSKIQFRRSKPFSRSR